MASDIRALSREWFEKVWNGRDESVIDRLASPEVVSYGLGEDRQPAKGLDQFKQFRRAFLSAFPDLKVKVEDILVEGDRSAVRLSFSGTHHGDGIGIPPTHRAFVSSALILMRWHEGKIVEVWNEFDAAGMMRQLQSAEARLRA